MYAAALYVSSTFMSRRLTLGWTLICWVSIRIPNRREERGRKRNHPQTNVINIAEKHEECLRIQSSI
jgi:hypothetical protein